MVEVKREKRQGEHTNPLIRFYGLDFGITRHNKFGLSKESSRKQHVIVRVSGNGKSGVDILDKDGGVHTCKNPQDRSVIGGLRNFLNRMACPQSFLALKRDRIYGYHSKPAQLGEVVER